MSIFWKPKGMPVVLQELRDGQHVEGYYHERFSNFRKKIVHAEISVQEESRYGATKDKTIYILIPGTMAKKRIGYFFASGLWCQDSDYRWRLYDGLRYTKPRRRRFP